MKTKKLLAIAIILLVMFCSFAFFGSRSEAAQAYDSNSVYWNYTVVDGKAILTSIQNTYQVPTEYANAKILKIPNTIAGYTVVQVGNGSNVLSSSSIRFEHIEWDPSCQVTKIGAHAFDGASFKEVIIPDSVTRIEDYAFQSNTNATSIQIGSNVQYIGEYAFGQLGYASNPIENVVIPDSVTTMKKNAFRIACIKNLTIGNGIETIEDETFMSSTVENVVFGSSVKTIGNSAFKNTYLSSVTIPNTVLTIGDSAFEETKGANKLSSLTLGSNVTTIGTKAFYNNEITSVTIPNSVTSIGVSAFDTNKISTLTIGSGITAIPELGFAHNEITTLDIPGTVKSVGNSAFRYNKLTSLTLHEGLQTIEQYAFRGENSSDPTYNQIAGTINIPSTVTSIGNAAFYKNKIQTLNFGTSNPTLGNEVFGNNEIENLDLGTGLQSTSGNLVFANNKITNINFGNVKTISRNAFKNAFGEIDLVIPGTIETIESDGFGYNKLVKSLTLNEGIKTIRSYAFEYLQNCKGDLTIPNSVTTLESSAFSNMNNLDGVVTVGTGITSIPGSVFNNMTKVARFNIPSNVTTINYTAFDYSSSSDDSATVGDIYIDNFKQNVSFDTSRIKRFVHWRNETHNMNINVLPGVHIINADSDQELTSGDYACDSDIDIKIVIDNGYTYSNLKLIVEEGNDFDVINTYPVDTTTTYDLVPLARNRKISVQSISSGYDLVLRTFISKVNGATPSQSRETIAELENGAIAFKHTKVPVAVKKGDLVTYTIRVYNEGMTSATADKINVFLPEGLELVKSNMGNLANGWVEDENDSSKVSTSITSNRSIEKYDIRGVASYRELSLTLKVTKDRVNEVKTTLNMIAEIGESSCDVDGITGDADSQAGSITAPVGEDYKAREAAASTSESYIRGQEDDDDFESVVLPGKVKITYDLHLRKADIADEQLLEGAIFRLYNERKERIADAMTNGDGEIDFGTMTSYGEGQDIYYMEEIIPPAGYAEKELCKIKVIVNKNLVDETTGECVIDLVCEKVDYRVDTSRYQFVPVTNKAELKKIGSGDTITIDGKEYVYAADANYKLMNNIDLSGEEWTPIENEIVGIFDGNGKTISGLTITSTGDYDKSEVGLFRVFSGIFENTTFTDVNISVNNFANDAANISGKTGVGTIAGVMREGVIYNVTISGTVVGTEVDNVGGFVGHTMPEKIVRAIGCTNNAQVSGKKNVGGVIGCSLGAVSVVNSTNTGAIVETCSYGNAGGFVGYIEATDYQETLFTGAYKDDNDGKQFTLVARNEELEDGTYRLKLENRDKLTRNLIPNGVYTLYGSDKQPISGLQNVTLTDGTADLGTYTFKSVGEDTYYLKEISPAPGYRLLNGYVRFVVSKCWDGDEYKFFVTVGGSILSEQEFYDDIVEDDVLEINPKTGKTNDITEHQNVYWNVNKAEFINCSNTAAIGGDETYHAGGILGTACKCHAEFENCSNSGTITGDKVAGIASNITCYNFDDSTTKIDLYNWSRLVNCSNTGAINQTVGYGKIAGGLVGEVIGNIKAYNCTNSGTITASKAFGGGIIAKVSGKTNVANCENYGEITVTSSYEKDYDVVVGGIIGGEAIDGNRVYDYSDTELTIENCTNTANITSDCHVGGIIGITNSDICIINNCKVNNDSEEVSLVTKAGNLGGIVSMIYSKKTQITNCDMDNTDLIHEGHSGCSTTDCRIGGIAAVLFLLDDSNYNKQSEMLIDNCNVTECTIDVRYNDSFGIGDSRAGIIADIENNSSNYPFVSNISNCTVKDTSIISRKNGGNANYVNTSGIVSYAKCQKINVTDCLVDGCEIMTTNDNPPQNYGDSGQQNIAGILAFVDDTEVNISNCDIKGTEISQEETDASSAASDNAAGIIACSQNTHNIVIKDCDVYGDSSITVDRAGNVGGIVSCVMNGNTLIKRCTFRDSDITSNRKGSGQENCTGCIVGEALGNIDIIDCIVDNVDVVSEHANVGGIVGHEQNGPDSRIDNCSVSNLNITKDYRSSASMYTSNSTIAGIAGNLNTGKSITNCTVDNVKLKSTYVCILNAGLVGSCKIKMIDNCSVSNLNIEIDESEVNFVTYNPMIAGGLIAYNDGATVTNCSVNGAVIKTSSGAAGLIDTNNGDVSDCTVKNITLVGNNIRAEVQNGKRAMGGAIDCNRSGTIENVNVDGVTVTGNIETFGGFVGAIEQGTFENCMAKNLDVNISNVKSTSWGAVAGFAGNINYSATLENVSVKDSELKTDEHIVAGLVGSLSSYWGSMTATIDGATVENVKLTHENGKVGDTDGLVSGLVGINPKGTTLNVTGANVKNCELVGNQPSGSSSILHVGGLLAFVDGDNSFTNCSVTETKITNNTTGMTGGAAGMTQYKENDSTVTERTLVINNVTVDGGADTVTISGKNHVGGILGFGKISVTTPVNVKNLVLKTLGTTGDEQVNNVIGVATDHTGESDVTVTNVTIE